MRGGRVLQFLHCGPHSHAVQSPNACGHFIPASQDHIIYKVLHPSLIPDVKLKLGQNCAKRQKKTRIIRSLPLLNRHMIACEVYHCN